MKLKRLLTSLILGLGLTLALGLPLSAGREARAMPLRADVWRELTLSPLEREEPQPTGSDAAPNWRNLPVTNQPIENPPEGLSEDAWDRIQAQLRRNSYELAPTSDAAGGSRAASRAHDLRVRFGIDPLIIFPASKLTASDAADYDVFGYSVAISGDTLVVGAPFEDGGAGDPLNAAGAAYVFERNQGGADNWGQVTILRASDRQASDPFGDNFGSSVSISGDTLVVGAR